MPHKLTRSSPSKATPKTCNAYRISYVRCRRPRFFLVFTLSFTAYAVGWIGGYFLVRRAAGEWLGSLAGSVPTALALAVGFGVPRTMPILAAALFVANSLGYFLGSAVNAAIPRPVGMLLWGALYGVFL